MGKITMIVVNKQQYLKELAHLTLLNCLNANGIIRFKYNQKLKQKQEREIKYARNKKPF